MIYDVNSPLYKSFLSTKGQAGASQAGKSAVPKKRDEKLGKGAKISAPPQPTSA